MNQFTHTLVATLLLLSTAAADDPRAKASKPPRAWLHVSREVTHLTEPLADDGLIDYAAALNKKRGEGVTMDNNAAVLLAKALGPGESNDDGFHVACERLGIARLPADGDYFLPSYKVRERIQADFDNDPAGTAKRLRTTQELLARQLARDWEVWRAVETHCGQSPWTSADEPLVAEWLRQITGSMQLMADASKLPRCHFPLATGKGNNEMVTFTWALRLVGANEAFSIRAMNSLARNRPAEAWSDALALRRLGTLYGGGPFLIDRLIGMSLLRSSGPAMGRIANYRGWEPAQLLRMQAEMALLPNLPPLHETLSDGERHGSLEILNGLVRTGISPRWLWRLLSDDWTVWTEWPHDSSVQRHATAALLDWNEVYRHWNRQRDEIEGALRMPAAKRRLEIARIDQSIEKNTARRKSPYHWIAIASFDLISQRRILAREFAMALDSSSLLTFGSVVDLEEKSAMELRLTEVALALARYRAEKGKYPDKLDELAPKYVAETPLDVFSEKPIRYKREDGGFHIYSVGPNRKDDAGRNANDDAVALGDEKNGDPEADDVAVRVPTRVQRP